MKGNQLAGSMTCTNGQILEYNSVTDVWDCGAAITGFPLMLSKSSDESITSDNTLTLDADLSFTCAANTNYLFTSFLLFDSETTPDFQYAINAPAGSTGGFANSYWHPIFEQELVSLGTSQFIGITNTNDKSLPTYAYVKTAGTAGSCGVAWAQSISVDTRPGGGLAIG